MFSALSASCVPRQNASSQATFEDSPSCVKRLRSPSRSSPSPELSSFSPCDCPRFSLSIALFDCAQGIENSAFGTCFTIICLQVRLLARLQSLNRLCSHLPESLDRPQHLGIQRYLRPPANTGKHVTRMAETSCRLCLQVRSCRSCGLLFRPARPPHDLCVV